MNGWMKWIVIIGAVFYAVNNRYKILNVMLGNYFLRKWVVRITMSIPSLRSKLIQTTFQR